MGSIAKSATLIIELPKLSILIPNTSVARNTLFSSGPHPKSKEILINSTSIFKLLLRILLLPNLIRKDVCVRHDVLCNQGTSCILIWDWTLVMAILLICRNFNIRISEVVFVYTKNFCCQKKSFLFYQQPKSKKILVQHTFIFYLLQHKFW